MAGKLTLAALALAAAVAECADKPKATIVRPLPNTLLERLESRKLQTAQYRWTTEHHDIQNTGNSGWIGPAEATGVCKTTVRTKTDFGGCGAAQSRSRLSERLTSSTSLQPLTFFPRPARAQIIKSIASNFNFLTSSFYSTGVTSVGNGWWFGGDNQNTFW